MGSRAIGEPPRGTLIIVQPNIAARAVCGLSRPVLVDLRLCVQLVAAVNLPVARSLMDESI